MSTLAHKLFEISLLLLLCLAPSQLSIKLQGGPHITPADILLITATGFWLVDILLTRNWSRLTQLPPVYHLVFLAIAALSLTVAADKKLALQNIIQFFAYFLMGTVLFTSFLKQEQRNLKRAVITLGAGTLLTVLLALWQYFDSSLDVMEVRGTFGNRNVLGGYLAMFLPLCFAGVYITRNWYIRGIALFILTSSMTLMLSGGAYLAVAIVLLFMALAKSVRCSLIMAAALVVWQLLILPHLPRENDLEHYRSLALYNDAGEVEKRYSEWQAACNLILTHPWRGVGAGNYQLQIGRFYDQIPRRTGPTEPDTQNLYLVLAATCGVPGVCLFLIMLGSAVVGAVKTAFTTANTFYKGIGWGIAGGLLAYMLAAVWHPLLVRGVGIPLVFLLAAAQYLRGMKFENGE